ncbi:MAG TPA: PHB depolymerase family esterase [Patescibacteria group bacterium]|nr:PHB depolymerase family esterase [Patescibacteria group bacterium]
MHVPKDLEGKPGLPVMMVLHGGGGNAKGMQVMTGMDGVADKNGFIAVYPEGYGSPMIDSMRTWNAGTCCGAAVRKDVDDVGYIGAVIDALSSTYKIDTRRVYATGHSNGAMMSYRLACEMSDRIAAIAPNAGQRGFSPCNLKRPVPVMHIHGTEDPCALYGGGDKCGGCFSRFLGIGNDNWPCKSVPQTVQETAEMNGCGKEAEVTFSKGAVSCESFACPQNAAVQLCAINGAGHIWAGKHDRGPAVCAEDPDKKICTRYREIVGPPNADIDAGQLAWDFVKQFRLSAGK